MYKVQENVLGRPMDSIVFFFKKAYMILVITLN